MDVSQFENIVEVVTKGIDVFEDKSRFNEWMRQPNTALGGKSPLSLIDSDKGIREILDVLGRLRHGVYS